MKRREFMVLAAVTGAAAALPSIAVAQNSKLPRLALVSGGLGPESLVIGGDPLWSVVLQTLATHNFVEGKTVVFERYTASADLAVQVANQILGSAPDAIFWGGARTAALAALAIDKRTPMVAFTADMLADGFVTNLAHPGGNITGVSSSASFEVEGRILELLASVLPRATKYAYLVSGTNGALNAASQRYFDAVSAAAKTLGVSVTVVLVEPAVITDANFAQAFDAIAKNKIDALQLAYDTTAQNATEIVARLASAARLPTIAPFDTLPTQGGLMSYGPDFVSIAKQAGDYIAAVLSGANPGDLPVVQPTVFNLIVNLKTATALGITVPPSVLVQATRVIQ